MAAGAKKTNWFAIWTSIMVAVIVIGVGAAVVVGNNMANPTYDLTASEIDESTGAVTVGEGESEVATYIDFMCPACNSFEQQYGNQLLKLASENKITLSYRPVSILDGQSQGTRYSTRAANAFYCVAEDSPKAVVPFVESLFKNQPREGTAGLDDAKLVELAKAAGAGDISECQADLGREALIATTTESMPANPSTQGKSTPTVTIDDSFTPLNTIYNSRNYFSDLFGQK